MNDINSTVNIHHICSPILPPRSPTTPPDVLRYEPLPPPPSKHIHTYTVAQCLEGVWGEPDSTSAGALYPPRHTDCERPPPTRAGPDNEDKIAANNLISR